MPCLLCPGTEVPHTPQGFVTAWTVRKQLGQLMLFGECSACPPPHPPKTLRVLGPGYSTDKDPGCEPIS